MKRQEAPRNLLHIRAEARRGDALAVVELPRGAKAKYEYDFELGVMRLARVGSSAFASPANYGFVPRTWSPDSSPLDVLILCQEALYPGTLVEVRVLGMLEVTAGGKPDPKLLSAAVDDPLLKELMDLEDVPPHLLREVAHFFARYRELEGREIVVGSWLPRGRALEELDAARARYRERFPEGDYPPSR
ncbi:MAG: inorganic diphosphatase [Euryarchaeota archaeon]|nr:inorganic diphosphatase [Euryarchaeota archaeon]